MGSYRLQAIYSTKETLDYRVYWIHGDSGWRKSAELFGQVRLGEDGKLTSTHTERICLLALSSEWRLENNNLMPAALPRNAFWELKPRLEP
jgi:hypothetical protein